MERKTSKMLLAILMIISILATDFFVLGSGIMTYALQSNSETNNTNIEFSTYFKEGNNRIDSIEKSIKTEDLKLYAEIKVKKDGYLKEGTVIELENNNFNFKNEILPSNKYIKSINENKVVLKQIDNESIVEIELRIKPIITEKQTSDFLSKTSTVKMKGVYVYSKSEEGEAITADKLVCVNYIPDESTKVELDTKIITNKVFSVNGVNKKVVQVLVKSRLNENSYPIKQTMLKANIPNSEEKPEVNAIAINKLATNGMNLISNLKVQDGIAEIAINNEPDENNQINWNKNIYDEVVITYIYPENVDTTKLEITTELETKVYNSEKVYTSKHTTKSTNEELNNIIIGRTEITTKELYKGQIYEKIETQYNTKTSIVVTNPNIVGEVTLNENSNTFETAEKSLTAKTKYISTKINLEKMLNILGENGSITIKNGEETIVANKDTAVDSNGDIIINYANSESSIDITVNNTIGNRLNAGILELEHTKAIIENNYSRKQLQEVKMLKAKGTISASLDKVKIAENATETSSLELKETITKAELTIENDKQISTTNQNEMVLGIRLVTNGPQHDLYKNPKVNIKFPQAVNNVELISNPNKQNADEFAINVGNFNTATKTLQINLQGEQTKYQQSELMQSYIQLNLKITLDNLALGQTDKIIMEYINENAIQYDGGRTDMGVEEQIVQISAPSQLIKRYNLNANDNNSLTETILQKVKNQNKVDLGISLTNNKDSDISNLKILGKLPTVKNTISGQGENTLETTLKGINAPNAKIYYTENTSANPDIQENKNGWTQDLSSLNNAKLYLIEVENLKRGETYTANLEVQSNSDTGLSYTQYGVIYNTTTTTNVKESSRKIGLATSMAASIKTNIKAQVGQDVLADGDIVKEGEVIKYTVTVENKGTQTLENVKLKLDVPEGTTYVKRSYLTVLNSYYEEITDKETLSQLTEITIPQLSKEPYVIEYEVRVNKGSSNKEILNKTEINYDNSVIKVDEIKNMVEEANLRVTVKEKTEQPTQNYPNKNVKYIVYVENISDSPIKNIKLNIKAEGFNIEKINDSEQIETIQIDEIEPQDKSNMESIMAGVGIRSFIATGKIDSDAKRVDVNAIATDSENRKHRSNVYSEVIPHVDIKANMTSSSKNKYVQPGDIVKYSIDVKNIGDVDGYIKIRDIIPDVLEIQEVLVNNVLDSFATEESAKFNIVELIVGLKPQSQTTIDIVTKARDFTDAYNGKIITNLANAEFIDSVNTTTQVVSHILKTKETEESDIKNVISGLAWYDINGNGIKDMGEDPLSNMNVKLYDVSTNSYALDNNNEQIETITNEKGEYTINKVKNGSYLLIFEHDKEQYEPTKPMITSVDDSLNSKAILKYIKMNTEKIIVTAIKVDNLTQNIFNMNIGLKDNNGEMIPEQLPEEPDKPDNPDNPDNPNIPVDPDNPNNPNKPTNPERPTEKKSLEGFVWLDSNINGRKDKNEIYLSGIKVKLYNVSTQNYLKDENGKIIDVITDSNGKYSFTNIDKGLYIVIFEYNINEYKLTNKNINIVNKKIEIDGKEVNVAVTNTIELEENISNINLGLQENLKFDLELNKYISKIIVQTNKKTKTYDYEGKTLGKVEIHRKEMQGANVILEYAIKIKNTGEIDGYAKNIVDYLPSGLQFSSELNKDWYLWENYLHTKGLENVQIRPGEEKEIKLVLTKEMTNENLGLINNRAEIYQDYNKLGESDIDSIPNNQNPNEDDFGTTDVIIQIATGGSTISYVILAIINIVLIAIAIKIMIINGVIEIKTKEERR